MIIKSIGSRSKLWERLSHALVLQLKCYFWTLFNVGLQVSTVDSICIADGHWWEFEAVVMAHCDVSSHREGQQIIKSLVHWPNGHAYAHCGQNDPELLPSFVLWCNHLDESSNACDSQIPLPNIFVFSLESHFSHSWKFPFQGLFNVCMVLNYFGVACECFNF